MKSQIFKLFSILILLVFLSSPNSQAKNLHGALEELANELSSQMTIDENPVVVIPDFLSLQNEVCDLGRYLSKRLAQILSSNRRMTIVEKTRLDFLGHNLHLNPTSSENIRALQNHLGANLLIIGEFTVLPTGIEINIRLYSIDRNMVLHTVTRTASKDSIVNELAKSNCSLSRSQKSAEVEVSYKLTPSDWRDKEKHGIGFGYWRWNHIFYNYNLTQDLQLHIGFTSIALDREDTQRNEILSTTGSYITGEVRYFPDPEEGWFIGGGSGYGSISQTYKYDSFFGVDTDSTSSFIPVFVVGGWQGWDGYYFTIDLSIGSSIVLKEEDNTSNVPDYTNHRTVAKEDFKMMKNPTSLGVLFGWYL